MITDQSLVLNNFARGIQEGGDKNACLQGIENFFIDQNNKLCSRPGSIPFDVKYTTDFENATDYRGRGFADLNGTLILNKGLKIFYLDKTFSRIPSTGLNNFLESKENTKMLSCFTQWRDELHCVNANYAYPLRIFNSVFGLCSMRLGLPKIKTYEKSESSGDGQYKIAMVLVQEYVSSGRFYKNYGEVCEIYLENIGDQVALSKITIDTSCLDLEERFSKTYVEYYCSNKNESRPYLERRDPLKSVVDDSYLCKIELNKKREEIELPEELYDLQTAPQCRYICNVDNTSFFGNLKDYPHRLQQSPPGSPHACIPSAKVDFSSEITGLCNFKERVIVFTKTALYRVQSTIDFVGGGVLSCDSIDSVGCIAPGSIVKTKNAVYFFSQDGIYYTDGLRVQKLDNQIDKLYQSLEKELMVSTYDRNKDRIIWGINDTWIVLNPSGGITKCSGAGLSTSHLYFFNGQVLRLSKDGYIYGHDESYRGDKLYLKGKEGINYKLVSPAYDLDLSDTQKILKKISLGVQTNGKFYLDIKIKANTNSHQMELELPPLSVFEKSFVDDENTLCLDDRVIINASDVKFYDRLITGATKRCQFFQFEISSSYGELYSSEYFGWAKILVISADEMKLTGKWPCNVVGKDLIIDSMSFRIKEQFGKNITIKSVRSSRYITGENVSWKIFGYYEDHSLKIDSIIMSYALAKRESDSFENRDAKYAR
ncbi:MAG: hypothetical protein HQK50_09340 [Oligoflexia bacterium]|nr:hypothetical protein [Oligoflexia bacterium]